MSLRQRGLALALGSLLAAVLGAAAGFAAGQTPPAASAPLPAASIERIVHAAKLWGEVRYFHPWIVTRDIDWDAAFVRALPRIESERDERAGLQALLDELHDPVTAMVSAKTPAPPKPASSWARRKSGVLTVKLERLPGFSEMSAELAKLQPEIASAKALLLDARGQGSLRPGVEDVGDELIGILGGLAPRALVPPAQRVVVHSGYSPQRGNTSGGYSSGLLTILPVEIPAGKPGPTRIALVADATTPLPPAALALQQAGVLRIFAEGPVDDRSLALSKSVDLAPGLRAVIRTGDLESPVEADVTVGRGQGVPTAIDWLESASGPSSRSRPTSRGTASGSAAAPRSLALRRDKTYPDMHAPDRAYRLLALVRFWNVIDRFYPYKSLLDRPWEEVLREYVPRFERAEGADGYTRAVLEMSAEIQDSHVRVFGSDSVRAIIGEAFVGLRVQLLDGAPVVVEIWDPGAPARGVRVGDVIEEIDGESLLGRAAKLEKYAAGSLPLGRKSRAIDFALAGPKGSAARLKLNDGSGRPDGLRTIQLVRDFHPPPDRPAFRIVDGNVGYADLTRLTRAEVDTMFDKLGSTSALVLDMRGYPNGTAWLIAPRLNVKKATHAAWFEREYVSGDTGEAESPTYKFQQEIPPNDSGKPLYRGRVVMLIDEFAISQSEHSGLFFEAATDITYVGSPTAGANGDVTVLSLPGGLFVSFTGHDVRHADGRRLQRVGLQPQILVRPTAAGIRAGKDEVLERALDFLRPER